MGMTTWMKANKCTVYKCRASPNPRNRITIQGVGEYYYCDKCWPFIKDNMRLALSAGAKQV